MYLITCHVATGIPECCGIMGIALDDIMSGGATGESGDDPFPPPWRRESIMEMGDQMMGDKSKRFILMVKNMDIASGTVCPSLQSRIVWQYWENAM